jgi:hypothetical protein
VEEFDVATSGGFWVAIGGQWQGIDALLELQIPIDGKETVKLGGGAL